MFQKYLPLLAVLQPLFINFTYFWTRVHYSVLCITYLYAWSWFPFILICFLLPDSKRWCMISGENVSLERSSLPLQLGLPGHSHLRSKGLLKGSEAEAVLKPSSLGLTPLKRHARQRLTLITPRMSNGSCDRKARGPVVRGFVAVGDGLKGFTTNLARCIS